MKEQFEHINFRQDSLALIDKINDIVSEYAGQGFVLTVRQLYYQLVSRDSNFPNTERSYKNTVKLVNNARLAGKVDWDAIEDRTRAFKYRPSWLSGSEIINSCAQSFHMNMWRNQDAKVFCVIEKEALSGVLAGVCREYDIPLLAAKGYPSASVLYEFAKNEISQWADDGDHVVIVHLGDHDPSGIDMTRDLTDRLSTFCREQVFSMRRIALSMDQINDQKPPPNPAKTTDSRFDDYARLYGNQSWELDALQPKFMADIVKNEVEEYIDWDKWGARQEEIDSVKSRIKIIADKFED